MNPVRTGEVRVQKEGRMQSTWAGQSAQSPSPRQPRGILGERAPGASLEPMHALHPAPESTLVPSHAGERVAVDGVEIVVVRHVVGEDLGVDHVAFALLARLVHGLRGEWPVRQTEEKHDGESTCCSRLPHPHPASRRRAQGRRKRWHPSTEDAPVRGLNYTCTQRLSLRVARALHAERSPPTPLTWVSLTVAVLGARGWVRVMV